MPTQYVFKDHQQLDTIKQDESVSQQNHQWRSWMDTHHANSRVDLSTIDWEKGRQAKTHPFRVRVTPTTIYNHETNEVVATAAPGYEFYYAHQHPHIAPVGFDTKGAIEEVDGVKTQVAQYLGDDIGTALGSMVGSRVLTQLLATSIKG